MQLTVKNLILYFSVDIVYSLPNQKDYIVYKIAIDRPSKVKIKLIASPITHECRDEQSILAKNVKI